MFTAVRLVGLTLKAVGGVLHLLLPPFFAFDGRVGSETVPVEEPRRKRSLLHLIVVLLLLGLPLLLFCFSSLPFSYTRTMYLQSMRIREGRERRENELEEVDRLSPILDFARAVFKKQRYKKSSTVSES